MGGQAFGQPGEKIPREGIPRRRGIHCFYPDGLLSNQFFFICIDGPCCSQSQKQRRIRIPLPKHADQCLRLRLSGDGAPLDFIDQQIIGQLRAEAEKQVQQQFQEQIEKLTQEKERAEQKAQQAEEKNRQLESKASSVQSRELIVFDEKFKAFQDNYNQLNTLIAKMEDATAGKVREAVKKLLSVMTENLG